MTVNRRQDSDGITTSGITVGSLIQSDPTPFSGERGRDNSFATEAEPNAAGLEPSGTPTGTAGRRERKRRDPVSGKYLRVPNTLGRYPFSALAKDYLSALQSHRAPLTLEQLRRDLLTIDEDVRTLHGAGR